jgi:hypothetical protein
MGGIITCNNATIFPFTSTIADDNIFGRSVESVEYLKSSQYNFSHSDLKSLLEIFKRIDSDSKHVISVKSILRYFNIECTPCNHRILSHLKADLKPIQYLSFIEFVITIWNFLTLPMDEIKIFILAAFNIKSTNEDDPKGLLLFVNLIHFVDSIDFEYRLEQINQMNDLLENNISLSSLPLIENPSYNRKMIRDTDSVIVLDGMLVTPILSLQIRMSKLILGKKYWIGKMEHRCSLPREYNSRETIIYLRQSIVEIISQDQFIARMNARHTKRSTTIIKVLSRSKSSSHHEEIANIMAASIISIDENTGTIQHSVSNASSKSTISTSTIVVIH